MGIGAENFAKPGTTFTGREVIRILRLLEEGGVPVWLDGAWGVDALLRRETGVHRHMDVVVPLDCLAAAELLVGEVGFAKDDRGTDMPTRVILRNTEGLTINICPVAFNQDGSAVHLDTDKEGAKYPYVYAAAGFSGVGAIAGCIVHCITAVEQIRQKIRRRYSPWSETRARARSISGDLEDIDALLQVFGAESGGSALAATEPGPHAKGNAVVEAAEQFCLRHVASLNAQHLVLKTEHAKLIAEHADLHGQHEALIAEHARLCRQHETHTRNYAALHGRFITQFAELSDMRASTSWRLTAPVRRAVRWLGLERLKTKI